jgi:hypothetical protein
MWELLLYRCRSGTVREIEKARRNMIATTKDLCFLCILNSWHQFNSIPLHMIPIFTTTNTMPSTDPFALHWSLYPRHYVAPRAPVPLSIDGNLDKPEWQNVPFSDSFDEIRGAADAPPGTRPPPTCRTRMKMQWDDEYLYIGAKIESDFTVTANFTEHNSPIFQQDSDFEVFLNPSGSCHDYKELELNAINTVWNLMLDKPYDDNGHEHSGRIAKEGEADYYEVKNQKTVAKVIQGQVGDPKGATWVVELALSHSDTLAHDPNGKPPAVGDRWRINFSRVEHKGDTNWTWQAQAIWDPILKRVAGKVAMHLPDAWGYVEFADTSMLGGPPHRDPFWPVRLTAMNLYYAQRRYKELNWRYASTFEELKELVDEAIVKPFLGSDPNGSITIKGFPDGFSATVTSYDAATSVGRSATVTEERLLTVATVENQEVE